MKPKARRSRGGARDGEAQQHLRNAQALENMGRIREAAEAYTRATALQPRNVVALSRLGLMLRSLNLLEESRDAFERALRVDPRHVESIVLLAAVYKNLRNPEKALELYERATWLDRREVRAHTGKAGIYEQLNRMDEGERAVRGALEADPNSPSARTMLARFLRRKGETERAAEMMRELLTQPINDEARHRAGFELGRCLEKLGRYDEAFEAIREANRVQAQTPISKAVDSADWLKLLDDSLEFTGEQFERWARTAPPDDGPAPVLLVGFPRSGTTMTEQILAAHPDIGVSDEQDLFTPMYQALFPNWDNSRPLAPQVEAITDEQILAGRRVYREEAAKLLKRTPGATMLVDKNPMNLVSLGIVSRVFPNARVIVAMRDPRDACLSCFFQEFMPNSANVYFFSLEGTLEMYRRVMDVWLAQRDILRLPILPWKYEEATRDFDGHARTLIEFVGRPWDDVVLRFYEAENRRFVSTPSYEAITSPVHTKAQGKWRRYEEQLAPILPGLETYVRALGYEI
jgi:tetratricopeptide (TPR) repeat protein